MNDPTATPPEHIVVALRVDPTTGQMQMQANAPPHVVHEVLLGGLRAVLGDIVEAKREEAPRIITPRLVGVR